MSHSIFKIAIISLIENQTTNHSASKVIPITSHPYWKAPPSFNQLTHLTTIMSNRTTLESAAPPYTEDADISLPTKLTNDIEASRFKKPIL